MNRKIRDSEDVVGVLLALLSNPHMPDVQLEVEFDITISHEPRMLYGK